MQVALHLNNESFLTMNEDVSEIHSESVDINSLPLSFKICSKSFISYESVGQGYVDAVSIVEL